MKYAFALAALMSLHAVHPIESSRDEEVLPPLTMVTLPTTLSEGAVCKGPFHVDDVKDFMEGFNSRLKRVQINLCDTLKIKAMEARDQTVCKDELTGILIDYQAGLQGIKEAMDQALYRDHSLWGCSWTFGNITTLKTPEDHVDFGLWKDQEREKKTLEDMDCELSQKEKNIIEKAVEDSHLVSRKMKEYIPIDWEEVNKLIESERQFINEKKGEFVYSESQKRKDLFDLAFDAVTKSFAAGDKITSFTFDKEGKIGFVVYPRKGFSMSLAEWKLNIPRCSVINPQLAYEMYQLLDQSVDDVCTVVMMINCLWGAVEYQPTK